MQTTTTLPLSNAERQRRYRERRRAEAQPGDRTISVRLPARSVYALRRMARFEDRTQAAVLDSLIANYEQLLLDKLQRQSPGQAHEYMREFD